jgi:hypothetical protein
MWDNSKPDKNVTFGVRAGLNMSNLTDDEIDYFIIDRLNSFHVGVNVDYNINKSFALESGVFFTDKGFVDEGYSFGSYHRYFIQVPVMVRFKFYVSEDFNIQLKAGGFGAPIVGSNSGSYVLEYNDFDAGLIGGIGISYKNFYLGAQYEYGLTDILNHREGVFHTSNIAISLGYDF